MTRVRVTRTAARSWERDVNHARRDVMTPASLGTSVSLQSLSFFSRGSVRARPKFLAPRAAGTRSSTPPDRARFRTRTNRPVRYLPKNSMPPRKKKPAEEVEMEPADEVRRVPPAVAPAVTT